MICLPTIKEYYGGTLENTEVVLALKQKNINSK